MITDESPEGPAERGSAAMGPDGLEGNMTPRDRRATARNGETTGADTTGTIPDDASLVAGDFELTPAVNAVIDRLARAGRDDPAARNRLYTLLGLKTTRFLAPYKGRSCALGDYEDIAQEAFLVFAALVADWSGAGHFAAYYFGFFPWRLRHAIEVHERRWPCARIVLVADDLLLDEAPSDTPDGDPLTALWPLPTDEGRLLALRLATGLTIERLAPLLGWSRRTVFRRWKVLLGRLDRELRAS